MADQIVLLSKGEVLTKGSFAELIESEVLDAVLDTVHKKPMPNTRLECVVKKRCQEPAGQRDETIMLDDVTTGLEIPEEDRSIGTVSLKLYWKYFRAGIPSVAMIGLAIVFLLAQGKKLGMKWWSISSKFPNQKLWFY